MALIVAELASWTAVSTHAVAGERMDAYRSMLSATRLARVESLAFCVTLVVFLSWVYRATANLRPLGSLSVRFTPGWAVGYFFIPIVQLWRGYQVVADIWRESQPAAVDEHGAYLPRKATLVGWWWALRVLSFGGNVRGTGPLPTIMLNELAHTAQVMLVIHFASAVLFLLVIRGAQARQDAQWDDLVRRRNLPQPSAEALR